MKNELSFPKIKVTYQDKDSNKRQIISSPDTTYQVLKGVYKDCMQHHEECWVLYLNHANKLLGISCISSSGISSTIVDIRIIIQTALVSHASAILLSHNHPSGSLKSSGNDDKLTKRLKNACELLDINLLDHVIITEDGYYSYANEGML